MSEIKRIENAAGFLRDNGLLFEINRMILHPLGLALEIQENEPGEFSFTNRLWDYRDDPEGILYANQTFNEGEARYRQFMGDFGHAKLAERETALGFIYQDGHIEEVT